MKTLELYIHIPFCVRKCSYCDFLSAPAAEDTRQRYVEQLIREITACSSRCQEYQITTIFIGGGTPSILTAKQAVCIMEAVRRCFHVRTDAEITIECNPGTLDVQKLRAYRNVGMNRLSIGLQSADFAELKLLGRIHTFGQFEENFIQARGMGFKNINVDLISALPGQKLKTYENTLRRVIQLKPEHISAYSLMIEEGTPFFERFHKAEVLREQGREQNLLPTEEEERQMYVLTKELLAGAGYHRYEISNYALEGFLCRHNAGYWTRENYLGLGLGAASMLENVRFSNTRVLQDYLGLDFSLENDWHTAKEQLDIQAQMEEFMFLGLRMMCGVSSEAFSKQFSIDLEEVYGEVLERQLKQGFIKKTKAGYCLTDYGIDLSNYVMAEYLLDLE